VPDESVRTSDDGRTALLTLAGAYQEGSAAAESALGDLRTEVAPAHLDGIADTEWAVGGGTAESVDYAAHQVDKLPLVIGFVLGLTLLMMGLTFRSPVIALLTTVLNLASVSAAFGVLTLVFQYSWAESLLDFTSTGFVVGWIPLFLFVVLVGLSMDYHVFVLSRIREGVRRGLTPRAAVEAGVSETAGVVTSAAAVMVSVFAVFATLSMVEMKEMGVGLSVAILVDATLIRVIMLPSMLVLLGRAAWWPARSPGRSVPAAEPRRVSVLSPTVTQGYRQGGSPSQRSIVLGGGENRHVKHVSAHRNPRRSDPAARSRQLAERGRASRPGCRRPQRHPTRAH
ncbi:MAG: MMPL family transporter, partial [Propionibacteriales bacterium]|nr:MMPL family transporter [Propionibacteriales bacterium]